MLVFHGRILRIQGTTTALAPTTEGPSAGRVEGDESSYAFLKSEDTVAIVGVAHWSINATV